MKKLTIVALFVMAFFAVIVPGCKDNATEEALETVQSATDNATADAEFSSVFEIVDAEGSNQASIAYEKSGDAPQETNVLSDILPECATVSVDSSGSTKTVTITFNENCLCKDGIYRSGKIIASFNGPYKQVGTVATITLEDYEVNGNPVTGTKTITRTEANKWTISVSGASYTTETGTISWNANRTIERTAGSTTKTVWDDEYTYTGSASGVNRKGISFTVTTDEPLKKRITLGCIKNFIAGVLTIQNDQGSTMTIDYDPIGGEPCDKIADVTINGVTKRITLR